MRRKKSLKILLFIDIALLVIFISYKSYLFVFEADFASTNIKNIQRLKYIKADQGISFAVLGNIKSSLDIFDKKIVKKINNDNNLNFVISTGNAVIAGDEDKYRILNKSLNKIKIPTIIGIGEKENSNGGATKFYDHYGPYYFSYSVNNAYFIFLDTTGITSQEWQKAWLIAELSASDKYKYKFVIMNKSPFDVGKTELINKPYSDFLRNTFSEYKVNAVFTSGYEIFDRREIKGVQYFISGGAGGALLLNNENSFYHYIKVNIRNDEVAYSVINDDMSSSKIIYRVLENIWYYIHAIFYSNFFNFILMLCILIFLGLVINYKVTKSVNYYNEFEEASESIENSGKLNIAMFTNNYFPFIGGVPISIDRLAKGLRRQGHKVVIFAPKYPLKTIEDVNVIRCNLLIYYKSKAFDFAIVNIFSSQIEKVFSTQNFDVIHVHHPFWMGTKGLELGKKYGLPVILTYHTRLEKYAHNLPVFKLTFENIASHKLIKIFSQKCDAIFAPTNSASEYLANIGVSRDKAVLPTGVDFDFYNNVDVNEVNLITKKYKLQNEVILCSVSRLTVEKNIYFLLEGIKRIKDNSKVPFKCIIIGDGPEKQNILKTIENRGLKNIVILAGALCPKEVCKYYMASNIFVFSSESETQGMVILEAMAGKCAVVAIRSSGIDDIIHNEYNGFKTKADLDLWSEKVIYLIEHPEILECMCQNAYDFSKKFSLDAMATTTVDLYKKAIIHKRGVTFHE
ncbi:glycosyltransferase [Clostridium bowmanii]|uniref:glycosyltransferase n=1 Tax=Clostridium bowmanii TaxID=132925 RepID=UPI001C0CA90B|nr:glycosyltransferase [Clostridium bowmanii]MBU3188067.1 glycosyltransferase [Clostridium bowmanii]MCA1072248.1 glycosyltransferase [Clostridium bowmanii]